MKKQNYTISTYKKWNIKQNFTRMGIFYWLSNAAGHLIDKQNRDERFSSASAQGYDHIIFFGRFEKLQLVVTRYESVGGGKFIARQPPSHPWTRWYFHGYTAGGSCAIESRYSAVFSNSWALTRVWCRHCDPNVQKIIRSSHNTTTWKLETVKQPIT